MGDTKGLFNDTTGICYTWSGDRKMYEPDLFSAELYIFGGERCYRYDSANNYTLVFGKENPSPGSGPDFITYLPYGDISIIHNIQDNGEDHYAYSGTYTPPQNWSPPAGVDGPFNNHNDLKYPYYEHTNLWSGSIYTWYNGSYLHILNFGGDSGFENVKYYGNKT